MSMQTRDRIGQNSFFAIKAKEYLPKTVLANHLKPVWKFQIVYSFHFASSNIKSHNFMLYFT